MHRVAFEKDVEERYSIAFFYHPNRSTVLEEIPSEMVRAFEDSGQDAMHGKLGITAGEHLQSRLSSAYGWSTGTETTAV